jgi:hypothetical protein
MLPAGRERHVSGRKDGAHGDEKKRLPDATRGRQVDLEENPGMEDGQPQDPDPRRPEAGNDPSFRKGDNSAE